MSIEADLTTDTTSGLLGVGDRLKAERVARGLSLDDVSQTLKVAPRVVAQLEANAWTELPGHTFVRGIVRGYAKFVHLDADLLLHELESASLPKLPVLEMPRSTMTALPVSGQSHLRDRLAMIAGVMMVAGAVMAYFLVPEEWFSSKPVVVSTPAVREPLAPAVQSEPVHSATANMSGMAGEAATTMAAAAPPPMATTLPAAPATAPVAAVAATALPAVPPVATEGSSLVLRFNQTSWVEVKDRNGVMLLSENVPAGNERSVSGTAPFGLAVGNAEGVHVSFRGKVVDLAPYTRQKVARLSLE